MEEKFKEKTGFEYEDIKAYLLAAYKVNINPLPQLRHKIKSVCFEYVSKPKKMGTPPPDSVIILRRPDGELEVILTMN